MSTKFKKDKTGLPKIHKCPKKEEMTPPSYNLKKASELTQGECFMPIPHEKTLGPCIKTVSISENGWEINIKGIVVAFPPKKVKTSQGVILMATPRHNINGVMVRVGDNVEMTIPRDTTIATPNPALGELVRKTTRETRCKDGKIWATYTCPNLPEKWAENFKQIIIENMAQKSLYMSEITTTKTQVAGIINTIPGHPLHHDNNLPFHPLPALFIKSAIQPIEEETVMENLDEFCQGVANVEVVDGEWRVELQFKGETLVEMRNNLEELKKNLAEQFLQIDADDNEIPLDPTGQFKGFISRHPDTFEKIKKLWEGKELEINI